LVGWPPFGHESIGHEPLTTLEQWKASRHRSLWLVLSRVQTDASLFGQGRHIICFAHAIDLVAENFIKNSKGFDNLVNKVRSAVKFVKSSTNLTKELHQCRINLDTSEDEIKKLILDIKMKWNSIFYMIKRFKLWNVINILIAKDEIPEIPSADEFVTLKEILDLLKPPKFVEQEYSAKNCYNIENNTAYHAL